MKLISRTVTLLAFGLCLASANAQPVTSQSLAECMIANTGDTDEAILKKLIIRAMQDAPTEELKSITIEMGMSMVSLATVDCGMDVSDLDGPVFGGAAEIYGQRMGEKLMTEAMAKIG